MVTKHNISELARAADLCRPGQAALTAWAQACITNCPDDYLQAHSSLAAALRNRAQRIAVIAPLTSWRSIHLSVLVFRPVYAAYEEVQRAWPMPIPELPLHLPVELEAGVGPYATGRHLVLFFENASPAGDLIPASERVGIEFLNTWRARWKMALPWLMGFASPVLRAHLASLEQDEGISQRAILESILAHEVGHAQGLWPISAEQTAAINRLLETVPVPQHQLLRVVCNALSDLAADTANVGVMTDNALIAVLVYHLLNVAYCLQECPALAGEYWEPLGEDLDCLGGVLVAEAVLKAMDVNLISLAPEHIRKGLLDVFCLVTHAVTAVCRGDARAVAEISQAQISPSLRQLLDSSPAPMPAADFQRRLPLQRELLPVILNCLGSDII
jgi:hypothetical protein